MAYVVFILRHFNLAVVEHVVAQPEGGLVLGAHRKLNHELRSFRIRLYLNLRLLLQLRLVFIRGPARHLGLLEVTVRG